MRHASSTADDPPRLAAPGTAWLKWLVIGLLILSGLDLRPVSAASAPPLTAESHISYL